MTMLSNETVRKLQEMHLGVMAEAFSTQLQDSQFQTVSFEDRFAMLAELTKDLPEKDYEDEEPWHIRPENKWTEREVF